METTRLSTKGQIILPKSIRTSHSRRPGTEFTVQESGDGVLLRPARIFPHTELDQVFGCPQYIVVRFLTNDDQRQSAAARSLFASGDVWIAKTVWLETAWVLNRLYGFEESAVVVAFTGLLGPANVHTDSKAFIAGAIALTSAGIDLDDAIHLRDMPAGATFVSFDEKLVRRAKRADVTEISGL